VKSHVFATNLIDLHIVENGSARLSFVRVSAQSHPTCRTMAGSAVPADVPRIRRRRFGLVWSVCLMDRASKPHPCTYDST
jgi:hypothetical protein